MVHQGTGSLTHVATSSTPPRSQVEESTCEKWCYCEKEENGEMIRGEGRDNCKIKWFHSECIRGNVLTVGRTSLLVKESN